jgi:hypothetical protein
MTSQRAALCQFRLLAVPPWHQLPEPAPPAPATVLGTLHAAANPRMAVTLDASLLLSLSVLLSFIKPTRAGTFTAALLQGSHVANDALHRERLRLVASSTAANAGGARARIPTGHLSIK